ncbi:MAG: hypothetical protein J6O90_03980, partial [Candidatus Methanomethylophilaceae archaeon]|nr:hypothetical protein [Candidatus Methanomethylophilaceae archaeon]
MVTERELYNAAISMEEIERPVATSLTLITQEMFMKTGISPVGLFDNWKGLAQLAKFGHDEFGFDSCEIFNIWSHVEYLGAEIDYTADQPYVKNPIYTLNDEFEMPDMDKYLKFHKTQVSIDGVKELRRLAGEDTPINCINSWGPLTCAGHLIGAEQVMMAMAMDPDNLKRLVKFISDFNVEAYRIELSNGQAECLDSLSMAEPTATGDMISPDMFEEFVQPYVAQEHKVMHEQGLKTMLHICGNTTANLPAMIACGSDAISVEQTVDPYEIVQVADNRVCMFGNIGPIMPLWQ